MAPVIRGNSIYTIVDGPSWTQAEANAVQLGGHLITFNNKEELFWIQDNILSGDKFGRDVYFTGLNDRRIEGLYEWASGESTDWANVTDLIHRQNWLAQQHLAPSHDVTVIGWGDRGLRGDTIQYSYRPDLYNNIFGTIGWSDETNTWTKSTTGKDTKGLTEIPFIQRGDSAYVIVEGPTWAAAEANAVKLGGHLVTVNDEAENAWLGAEFSKAKYQYAEDNSPWAPNEWTINHFWTGGTKVNGQWQWISGEAFSNTLSSLYLNNSNDAQSTKLLGIFNNPNHWANIYLDDYRDTYPINPSTALKGIAEIKLSSAPPTPTYTLSTSSSSINEGSTLTTTVSTSNVNPGTTLYYALSGSGISSADFSAGSLLGSGVVSSSGSFSFSHALANDLTTEGTETLEIKLFSDSARSTQVGSTASVSIRDTSTTPAPTYSLSVTPSVLGEGESFSSTVATTNLAAGTKLYYALSGTGISEADFRSGDRLTGFGTIDANGSFSFSRTLANDLTTEGTETLNIKLFSDAALATQVGSTATVTIYDTSTTPQAAINVNGNNNGIANTGTINNSGTINTGTINTNSGNTTNITNNNIDKSKTVTIAPTTINNITNNITNNISVNAVITNTSAPTYNVSNTYAKNLVGDVLTGSPQLNQNSYDAKFYNLGGGRYGVQQKGKSTIDEITGATSLQFQDQAISLASDVAATFNQVKGIDDVSGVVFRLYNAAFARLPDANGLENWINGNKSGGQTYASSALEFAKSQEFKNRYGSNVSDTQYVTTLYNNVLGRVPDAGGLAHYQGLLASGKDRGSLLLDFSESPENRGLFTKVTGLS